MSIDTSLLVFTVLLAFRITNALTVRTFFQPDEFFQSLEVAWSIAFGRESNAFITWEWRSQLRSSLHPGIFAAVYAVTARLADLCGFTQPDRAELLIATPKVTQALFAALLDFYTWKLGEKAYGRRSRAAYATLALSIGSPWNWFCSTRTLSNCLETTLTTIALFHWPWALSGPARDKEQNGVKKQRASVELDVLGLRVSLLLAALACILRPTNALVWLSLSLPTVWQASSHRFVLVREALFCGSAILACSVLADRLYYQVWTFPPLRFLHFNIAQSLAVFYGKNRADYYLTEGLPLLLTTALPFAIPGLWQALSGRQWRNARVVSGKSSIPPQQRILPRLAWTSILVTLSLSLIAHKEVRFLYPVLPLLHVLAAGPVAVFFPTQSPISRKAVLVLLLGVNVLVAGYASQVHQRGVIDVLTYLRHKHEARNSLYSGVGEHTRIANTTVAFLMPCHSTPWRSHLVHPEIGAWALTCEPPLDVPLADRSSYLDEADRFYIEPGPVAWLDEHMESVQTVTASGSRSGQHWARQDPKFKRASRRAWPQNVVFFEQLEPVIKGYLGASMYRECWRGFNSHFHDDARRVGDVVVWCLD